MGNYAQLLLVSETDDGSNVASDVCVIRYAKNVIPLFWWGLFEQDLLSYFHTVQDGGAYELLSMRAYEKPKLILAASQFGTGLEEIDGISTDALSSFQSLRDDIVANACSGVQLETSEIQALVPPDELTDWIRDGVMFANQIRTRSIQKLGDCDGVLLERSGIFAKTFIEQSKWEQLDKSDFAKKARDVSNTAPAAAFARRSEFESFDWEHSFVGIQDNFTGAVGNVYQEAAAPPLISRKQWWKFW